MILAISGKRESGKSTLAKALEKYGFKRVSLANPLKEMCKKDYNLNDDQVYGCLKESPTQFRRTDSTFFTPRDILIREGCLKRSIDPIFWCRKLLLTITSLKEQGVKDFVIDDIRFLNEINFFKPLGTELIRIERNQNAIGKAALDDLSETELDTYKDWDFLLTATLNRNIKDLERFAEYIVSHSV